MPDGKRIGLILTEDDLAPSDILAQPPVATLCVSGVSARSPLAVSPLVLDFTHAAMADTTSRYGDRLGTVTGPTGQDAFPDAFNDWVRMDLRYKRKRTPQHDLKIMLHTVPAVLKQRGAC